MKQKSYSLIDDFNDFDDKEHISLPKSTANIIKELELGTFLYDTFNLSTVDQSKSTELISFLSINIDNDKLPQIGINKKDLFCTIRIYAFEDEWYEVNVIIYKNGLKGTFAETAYLCDQVHGIIDLLKDLKEINTQALNVLTNEKINRIKLFEEYSQLYQEIDKTEWRYNFSGGYGLNYNGEPDFTRTFLGNYEDFTQKEINTLKEFFYTWWITGPHGKLLSDYKDYKGLNIINIHKTKEKMKLNNGFSGYSIGKCADEWYYLYNKNDNRYFKCDSFEGLIKCITSTDFYNHLN